MDFKQYNAWFMQKYCTDKMSIIGQNGAKSHKFIAFKY